MLLRTCYSLTKERLQIFCKAKSNIYPLLYIGSYLRSKCMAPSVGQEKINLSSIYSFSMKSDDNIGKVNNAFVEFC